MNELMASSNSVSITTAAVMTALNYRDELEKASGSADNMRRQIKNYLETRLRPRWRPRSCAARTIRCASRWTICAAA